MNSSIFAFATDLKDEGIERVLDNVQHRGGLSGITVAAAYHEGRDIFPHNPRRKVRFLEEGAIFFRPDPDRWQDVRLRPPVSEAADVLPELVRAARGRGLDVHAWTVFLHSGALARAHPDCAPENAYGDRYLTELCPANPAVRTFARTLAREIARLGVATIVAESLHYPPLEHGGAHERYFVPLGPRARYLLGLCFCPDCLDAARDAGVDGEALRDAVRVELDAVFDGSPEEPFELDGDLARYAAGREAVVSSLVADVAAAARSEGTAFEFLELSGAVKGYADGRPAGGPAREIAWQLGVDVDAVAAACDGIAAIGYAADPARVRLDLESYGQTAVAVVLRPCPPDADSAENLREKVHVAREAGLDRVDFYHYGLMRLDALDWIREALRP
jgi:hypothetical protein